MRSGIPRWSRTRFWEWPTTRFAAGIDSNRASNTRGFPEPEPTFHPIHHPAFVGAVPGLFQDVEALGHRLDDADAETFGGDRRRLTVVAPDQNRARFRIDDDVQAVFRR